MGYSMDLEFERKLTIPMETKKLFPVTAELESVVEERARSLRIFLRAGINAAC